MRELSMLSPHPQQLGSHARSGMVPFQQAYLMICEVQRLDTVRAEGTDIADSFDDLHNSRWKPRIGE